MKKIPYIMLLVIFFCCHYAAAAQDTNGYLTLISDSKVQEILVDDTVRLYREKMSLAAGTHRIVVQNPDRVSYQVSDFAASIAIRPGEETKVNVIFEDFAEINSYPSGAEVSVNSETLGITPFYLSLANYRGNLLRFTKPGYADMTIDVMDSMITRNYVFVHLQPKIINRSNNQNQFVNLEWQERGPHKNKNAILITQGLSIAFGAGAAYYKKKADAAFEKAKVDRRLGNVSQMDRHMNKARKYDRYAAVGFIGMQVNVAALIYFLFQSR